MIHREHRARWIQNFVDWDARCAGCVTLGSVVSVLSGAGCSGFVRCLFGFLVGDSRPQGPLLVPVSALPDAKNKFS